MIFPKAKKIGRQLQWHTTDDGVFGLYKNYLFQIGDGGIMSSPSFKYVVASTPDVLTEEQQGKLREALKLRKRELKYSNFEIHKKSVHVQFLEHLSFTKLSTVYALMDFFVEEYTRLGISSEVVCAQCKRRERLDYYILHDRGVLLCEKCFARLDEQHNRQAQEKLEIKNSAFIGFLGSLVYSIPGMVIWILVAVYIGYMAAALAIVIAFLGYKGYHAFRGQEGPAKKYWLVLSNIICILIANIMSVVIMKMREDIPLRDAWDLWFTSNYVRDMMIKYLLLSYALALVAWLWILFEAKEEKLVLRKADVVG